MAVSLAGGSVLWVFDAETGKFTKAMVSAEEQAKKTSKKINEDMTRSVNSTARQFEAGFDNIASKIATLGRVGAAVFISGALGTSQFVSLASDLQNVQQSMSALFGGAEQAGKALGQIYNYTLGKPIAFPTAAAASKTLAGYGLSVEDTISSLKDLGAISIVTGGDLGSLALAYGQVNARGKLMGQEVIQLVNQSVPIIQILADYFGKSLTDMASYMEGGAVSAEEFNAAISKYVGGIDISGFENTFKNRMISLQGTIRNLGLAFLGIRVDAEKGLVIEDEGLFDRLSKSIDNLTLFLKDNREAILRVFDIIADNLVPALGALAAAFVTAKVGAFIASIIALVPQLNIFITSMRAGATATQALNVAMLANPIGLIVAGITILVGVLAFLQVKFDIFGKTLDFIGAVWDVIKSAAESALNFIGDRIEEITGFYEDNKTAINNIGIVIGAVLLPKLAQLAGQLTVVGVRAAITFGGMAIQASISAASIAASFVASSVRAGISFGIMAAKFTVALVRMSTQLAIQAVRMAVSWALALGPIGLIVAAIVGIVALIIYNWDTVKSWLSSFWNWLKDTGSTAWQAISDAFNTVKDAIVGAWQTVRSATITAWQAVWGAIKPVVNFIYNIVTIIFGGILLFLIVTFKLIMGVIIGAWNIIYGVISTVVGLIWARIVNAFNVIYTTIYTILSTIWSVITTIWNAIWAVISTVVNAISGVISSVWNSIWSTISSVLSAIWNIVSSVWNSIYDTLTGIMNSILNFFAGAWNWLFDAGKNIVNGLVKGIKAVANTVWDAIKTAGDKIGEFFSGAWDWLFNTGKDIVNGLVNGIKSAASSAGDAAQELADTVRNKIKDSLKIFSPSRVMLELGEFTGEGFVNGILSQVRNVAKATDKLLSGGSSMGYASPLVAAPNVFESQDSGYSASALPRQSAVINQTNNVYTQVDMNQVNRDLTWELNRS